VTDVAQRILGALDEATQSKPKKKLENWKINEFVDILEDQNLSESLRLHYSNMLHSICTEHPEVVIANERMRELLWKTLAEPASDKVEQDLMRVFKCPSALRNEE
jgi:hypothetical protein